MQDHTVYCQTDIFIGAKTGCGVADRAGEGATCDMALWGP